MLLKFKNLVLVLILISWWSSPAYSQELKPAAISEKKVHIYQTSYSKVWDALQLAMGSYPLDFNDVKTGVIKTQKLGPNEIWIAPFEKPLPSNYSQILVIEVLRLNARTTQVSIQKQAEAQVDFFGSTKKISSSGWEELRLFYKIKRQIDLDRVLRRIKVN